MAKKTTLQPNERQFQNWFKDNFHGWLSQFHPGQSSDLGVPDLFVLLNQANVTPVEIKIGSFDGDGFLWCREIRPAQCRWHKLLANAGGISLIVCGVWCGDRWRAFAINGADAAQWDVTGFLIQSEAIELVSTDLVGSLSQFVYDWIE